ncbi:MAG: ABC transporter ATP-binding protein [Candidatus Aminicenantes bacterium]|nr:ABC transporter ATP-binding protein [Candidatus Aminicenantes bacterium]
MGIRVCGISKRFGDFLAVDDVSFEVKTGELVALLGPSGSGKSTILRIIAGLEVPDSGEVYLRKTQVTSLTTQKRGVGFVFQHYALFKHMTVEKNIAFGLEVRKADVSTIRKKVAELIDLVKLRGYEKHYPDQLSGGQRQRVALARALATEPAVLLLDEPFGALDVKVRDNLALWLRELHSQLQITSIFVTHDQEEAIEISDKIVVINRGRVEQMGNAREVYENPDSKFVASFIGRVNVLDAVAGDGRVVIKDTSYAVGNPDEAAMKEGDVVLLIRPEDVGILLEPHPYAIPAEVRRIHYRGSHYEVDCLIGSAGIRLIKSKNGFDSLELGEGKNISLVFNSYRVFEAQEGHAEVRAKLKELGYIE